MSNENTTSNDGPIQHAKLALPKPVVHASHPYNNANNHQALLEYLRQRLQIGQGVRDNDLGRMVSIDKNVAGWIAAGDEDRKRIALQETTGIPQARMLNLPLSYVHLDDMMTYFAATFAPNRGMFYHTGKPDEVGPASQIVTLMNNHALYAGYYREILLTLFGLLKYNSCGFKIKWSKEIGPKIVPKADGSGSEITSEVKWTGNRIESLDNYNFFRDPSVHPTKLYCEGEFAATAEMRSLYWLQNKASQGIYFNCEEAIEFQGNRSVCKYYRNPPAEANISSGYSGGTAAANDWIAVLSQNRFVEQAGMEIVEIYIRLDPTQFGLAPPNEKKGRKRYELWRFTILNDEFIIDATYMNNMHGYLPFFLGVLNDDLMGTSQKAVAEILQPLQDFASFLLNTHVLASRKKLWGLTVYDPTMVDLTGIPQGEVSARVPMKPESYGRDVRTGIWEQTQARDTNQTMADLESVMGIISQFFPTQSLPSQIANIDRAVDSQVAAVQQGANRRQQKAARLLDDSLFRPARFAMYYNILQFQSDDSEVQDYYTGKPVKIDLDALRQTDLPFIVGQGLKAIDRQAAAGQLQQIIFALIQAPQAAQGVKILDLIDYWTSMIDIDIDFKQFEAPVAPPAAAAPGAEAAGTGITPATNPQAITDPIYGS